MAFIVIRGGKKLSGTVRVSGSKNAALPCLIASLLTRERCAYENVPDLEDIKTVCELLTRLGKKVERTRSGITVRQARPVVPEAPYELVRRMRASTLVMGPLLSRCGRARVSLPGGCAIGNRPINLHLLGFTKLGARTTLTRGMVELSARRLAGARIVLDYPSVGATENLMMAASLIPGTTVIEGAAQEPEIVDLAECLNGMGAKVRGAGTHAVELDGVDRLGGACHRVIPDRIEAGTLLVAGAMTRGRVRVEGVTSAHLGAVTEKLREAGARVSVTDRAVEIRPGRGMSPVDIETFPYPGFPTDLQAQWMAFMSTVPGRSIVRETVFENRFLHVGELRRMGANVRTRGNTAVVRGNARLEGAPVMATDLRASVALILAGLVARGETIVSRVYHLDRGYERLEGKLRSLGAEIRRMK